VFLQMEGGRVEERLGTVADMMADRHYRLIHRAMWRLVGLHKGGNPGNTVRNAVLRAARLQWLAERAQMRGLNPSKVYMADISARKALAELREIIRLRQARRPADKPVRHSLVAEIGRARNG
jgi:hypothetical protein